MAKYNGFYDYALNQQGNPDRENNAKTFINHLKGLLGSGIGLTNATGLNAWKVDKIQDESLKARVILGDNNYNFASINGNPFACDEELQLEFNSAIDRWDSVMIRANATNEVRATDVIIQVGNIALTRTADIYDLRLARVHIVDDVIIEIIDDRLNGNYCGIADGLVTVPAEEILEQIRGELEALKNQSNVAFKNGLLQENLNAEKLEGKRLEELVEVGEIRFFSDDSFDNSSYIKCDGSFINSIDYPLLAPTLKTTAGHVWEEKTRPAATDFHALAYSNGVYVFGASDGGWTTNDFNTWTKTIVTGSKDVYCMISANGLFVGGGGYSTTSLLYTSPDGINWTARTANFSTTITGVAFGNGMYVIVGRKTNAISYSSTGENWTNAGTTNTSALLSVTFGNGIFVAVGESGLIITSTNGINWTVRTSGITNSINAIKYINGRFIGVGSSGLIITSTNGINWTVEKNNVSGNLKNISYGNGLYIIANGTSSSLGGLIYVSADFENWTEKIMDTSTSASYNNCAWINETFMLMGNNNTKMFKSPINSALRILPSLENSEERSVGYIKALSGGE